MTMHTTHALYEELNRALVEINKQIEDIKLNFELRKQLREFPENADVYGLRLPTGVPILETMLAARAQLLSGMAALKAADIASKAPRR